MSGLASLPEHLASGRRSEAFARRWLEGRGLAHLYSNFRSRRGELDLVMLDRGCLVIVEVRYRRTSGFGGPLWSVTPAKQRSIGRAAQSLLRAMPQLAGLPLRFDVIALAGGPEYRMGQTGLLFRRRLNDGASGRPVARVYWPRG